VSASAEAIFMSEDEVDIILPLPPSSTNENEKAQYKMTSILVRDFPKSTTTVVIDPPRKGCSTEFLDQLYQFNPQRVVYMSCDPATQARDAEGIVGAGYRITSIKPFDLFPQTRHIENLIIFERKS
jgi:tRNA/tmRNA/rRNA uracil-C5-methylase (TrmA/RlmC/RlmD family)